MTSAIYSESVADVFDSVAAELDSDSRESASAAHIRDLLVRIARRTFPPGGRVLEAGCRTGFLTLALADAGFRVTAIEASDRLLSILRENAADRGLSDRVEVHAVPDLDPRRLRGPFDAAVVPHGVVNLVGAPSEFAGALGAMLPRGAPLLLDVLNRHHMIELVLLPAVGRVSKGFRKMGGRVPVRATRSSPRTVLTQFYSPAEVARIFRGEFDLRQVLGAVIALPPPSMDRISRRMGPVRDALARFDERVRGVPPFRALGHHMIVVLERRA